MRRPANHSGSVPAVTISFDLQEGYALSDAVRGIEKASARIGMPPTIAGSFQGTAGAFQAATQNMGLLLAIAIVLGIPLGLIAGMKPEAGYSKAIMAGSILGFSLPTFWVGLVLIIVFMLVYYKASGINAVIALIFNLIILLGLMAYIGAVMTLPGIAGFVLTMGIGVDSNVLIFERIKEELEAQRGVRASINAGFGRVFWTLVDTHVAALISAGFLFQFGTGPIRGFAVTLFLGLLSNLFTSIFVSKTLFELELSMKSRQATLSI